MPIGPLVAGKKIRDAAKATLQAWLPSVLAEIRAEYDLGPDELPVPQAGSYHLLADTASLVSVTKLPAVLIATPSDQIETEDFDSYGSQFTLLVSVVSRGRDFNHTVDIADLYVLAVLVALTQHAPLAPTGQPPVAQACVPVGRSFEPLVSEERMDRTAMQGEAEFRVIVSDVITTDHAPLAPPADPLDLYEEVEVTEVTVTAHPEEP